MLCLYYSFLLPLLSSAFFLPAVRWCRVQALPLISDVIVMWCFLQTKTAQQLYEPLCRNCLRKRLDRKPGSVSNDDLSWPYVAVRLTPSPGRARLRKVASALVSSYLAFPSLPCKARRFLSVALSLGSPPAAVSSCYASVKPGLSSGSSCELSRRRMFHSFLGYYSILHSNWQDFL